jgi:transcriptional regulator with XRE-family HTH domain
MSRGPERVALRRARTERGWSQADAARELRDLARGRDGPDATAASLKTQLSRWENGHAVPEPEYRHLLGELYARTPEELGLRPEGSSAEPTARGRLQAELAAAAAVDDEVLALWAGQLDLARRLDDELGAAGAGELVRAQVEQLRRTMEHTLPGHGRAAVAIVLADTAELAGRQALDQGDPEEAWSRYSTARAAALESGSPLALVHALAGQAEVLGEVDDADAAVRLLRDVSPPGPAAARVRLAAALGAAHAAAGDAAAAHREFDRAALTARHLPSPAALPDPRPPGPRAPHLRPSPEPPSDHVRPDVTRPGVQVEVADLHRRRGHALAALRDPAAVEPLEGALVAPVPLSVRHRAAVHADLAVALGTAGRPAEATEHAEAARRLAERIGSRRIAARLARRSGNTP